MRINEVFRGIPARSSRDYLGWSACFVITTAKGRNVLFDTAGYNERVVLEGKLSKLGVLPEKIDVVVLSHFHFDHSANWDLFQGAEIILHAAELDYIRSRQSEHDPAVLKYHAQALFEAPNLRIVKGETDLGDGLVVMEAPGHTPGSVALKAEENVFCGDALKNRQELMSGQFTGALWDESIAQHTLARLTQAGRKLHPGHDAALERIKGEWVPIGTGEIDIELQAPAHIHVHEHDTWTRQS